MGLHSQAVQIGETLLEVLVAEAADFREDLGLLFDLELQRVDRVARQDLLRKAANLLAHRDKAWATAITRWRSRR